jgi:hypothetical protein
MAIDLIAKIAPKNSAFVGMVDADQIIGDGSTGVVPNNAISEASVTQHESALSITTGNTTTSFVVQGANISLLNNDTGFTTSASTGSTPSSSINHQDLLGILGSTSYYHLSSTEVAKLTGISTSVASTSHNGLDGILGSSSYYHISSGVYAVLTTGISSSYSHDNLTDIRGSTSYYHLSSTELAKLTNISTSVASTSHNSLDGILGSTSYYHLSSGDYAKVGALSSGLTTAYATTGAYVPYTGATSNVALGSYSLSGATGTFSSGLQANNLVVTSGLTATTGNFSSSVDILGNLDVTSGITASSGGFFGGVTVSSTLGVQNTAIFSSYGGFGSTSPTLSSKLPFYCYALSSQTKTFLFGGTDHPTLAYSGWDTQGWSTMEFYSTGGNGSAINLTGYSSGTGVTGTFQVLNDYITSGSERRLGLMAFVNESAYNNSYFTMYTMSSGVIAEAVHINSIGNVGIGTTSPSYKLSVNGGSNFTTAMSLGSVGPTTSAMLTIDTVTNGMNNMYLRQFSTNGDYDPIFRFQKWPGASSSTTSVAMANMYCGEMIFQGISGGVSYNVGAITVVAENGTSGTSLPSYMEFWNARNGAFQRSMIVDSSGNLSIGTTSPLAKITVAGGANVSSGMIMGTTSNNSSILQIVAKSTGTSDIFFNDDVANQGYIRYNHNIDTMAFATNALVKATLTSGGLFGIGTTSPTVALQVAGGGKVTSSMVIGDIGGVSFQSVSGQYPTIGFNAYQNGVNNYEAGITGAQAVFQYNTSSNLLAYYNDSLTASGVAMTAIIRMVIDSSGNFMVGTTSASAKFSVGGASYFSSTVGIGSGASTGASLSIKDGGTMGVSGFDIQVDDTASYLFRYTNTSSARTYGAYIDNVGRYHFYDITTSRYLQTFSTAGYMGINNSAPSYLLTVGTTGAGSTGTVDIWAQNTISAVAYIDRTPYPDSKEQAYEAVLSMQQSTANDGKIDHKKLSSYLKVEEGRDLSATVSAQNCVIQDIILRINKLEGK